MQHLISEEIQTFLLDRRARSLSVNTIKYYGYELAALQEYLTRLNVLSISDVTPSHIREFLLEVSQRRKPGGVHGMYRAVKAFFNWFAEEYDSAHNPAAKVKPPKQPREVLDPLPVDTLQAMLATCDSKNYTGLRDRAILICLYDSGLRRNEFLNIDLSDLDFKTGQVRVRHGKGGKDRTVYLGSRALRDLNKYLRSYPLESGPVWRTQTGGRLTPSGLRQIILRRARAANVPAPEIHDFRRAFALACLRNGIDLFSLMHLMGHTSPTVLQRYLKLAPEDLRLAHSRTSPADNL